MDPLIRDIEGYTNYQISENGEVYNKKTGRELNPQINKGYLRVTMGKKHFLVHRLLALRFIDNPENKQCVDHIDRNPLNNKLENLRWATHSENTRNTKCIGYYIQKYGEYSYYKGHITIDGKRLYKKFPYTDEGLEECKK